MGGGGERRERASQRESEREGDGWGGRGGRKEGREEGREGGRERKRDRWREGAEERGRGTDALARTWSRIGWVKLGHCLYASNSSGIGPAAAAAAEKDLAGTAAPPLGFGAAFRAAALRRGAREGSESGGGGGVLVAGCAQRSMLRLLAVKNCCGFKIWQSDQPLSRPTATPTSKRTLIMSQIQMLA